MKHLWCKLLGRHERVTLTVGERGRGGGEITQCLRCGTILRVEDFRSGGTR